MLPPAVGQSVGVAVGATIEERGREWVVQFDEPLVTQLRVDYQFGLLLEGGPVISIAEPFQLTVSGVSSVVPPGDAVFQVDAALPLFNQKVNVLRASESGELRVDFDSGDVLIVPVNEGYENWTVSWPDGEVWVGLPGGGIEQFPPGDPRLRLGVHPLTAEGRPPAAS